MTRRAYKVAAISLAVVVLLTFVPLVPINLLLADDLPALTTTEPFRTEDIGQIVTAARGGRFLSLFEVTLDRVSAPYARINAPFTHISFPQPGDEPGLIITEEEYDVVVGYKKCANGTPARIESSGDLDGMTFTIANCSGYRVFLRKTFWGWKIVDRISWVT